MSEIIRDGAHATVKPKGAVAAAAAAALKAELAALVNDGATHLTLDFDAVLLVDSMGLGVVIAAFNSVEQAGGSLRVVNLSAEVGSLFHTMRLDRHFQVENRP